jgi:signal transduction histidine kinase
MDEREHLRRFASGLAHEVRNPLNSIGLQLSLLERRARRLRGSTPGEFKERIGIIRSEVQRIDTVVADLLLLAQTRSGAFRATDLGALVDQVVRTVQNEAADVRLERRSTPDPLPAVAGDADLLRLAALSLVRRAARVVPKGAAVLVETGVMDGRVCLRVADGARGPREDLGLPIAQQIVHDHGGEIAVDRRSGQGTTFTVLLPAAPISAPAPEKKKP